jgi:hypothetical protein
MRVRLEALNLTLRGYPPREAQQVVDGLPAAIAFALDHPGRAMPGPSGAAGRDVAAAIRAQGAQGPATVLGRHGVGEPTGSTRPRTGAAQ